ncbi:hypothetical protein BGZ65_003080, partial [Modicella reniformis]
MDEPDVPLGYSVVFDGDWVQEAERTAKSHPLRDPDTLQQRLVCALADPFAVPANEDETKTLKSLLRFGLVVEKSSVEDSKVPQAQLIASAILNTSIQTEANKDRFLLRIGQDPDSPTIRLPMRSMTMLRSLAMKLKVNIYMFSTRSKSVALLSPDAAHSIGFLHRVDSILGISEYLVLTASQHIEPTITLPPRSDDKGFLPFKPAVFRKGERLRMQPRPPNTVSRERCHEGVKRAFGDFVQEQIDGAIATKFKKLKASSEEEMEVAMQDVRAKTLKTFTARTKAPKNTLSLAVDHIRKESNEPNFSTTMLSVVLRTAPKGMDLWHDVLEKSFEDYWSKGLEKVQQEATDKHDDVRERIPDDGNAEDQQGSKEHIRTCPVALKQILRPELQSDGVTYEKLVSLADEHQTAITNMVDELSCLTLKTVLIAASGDLYNGSKAQHINSLDIMSLLPTNFEPRAKIESKINVAPLPTDLQDRLVSVLRPDELNSVVDTTQTGGINKDLASLLTKEHLQRLHTRFLSPHQGDTKVGPNMSSKNHPLWSEAEDLIAVGLSEDPPLSSSGISRTITEHIGEYSTAVSNLWEGDVYRKSLEYLTRILLRLHLAPEREKKYKSITSAAAKAKRDKKEQDRVRRSESLSKSLYKSLVMDLCNELSEVEDLPVSDRRSKRMEAILQQLARLSRQIDANDTTISDCEGEGFVNEVIDWPSLNPVLIAETGIDMDDLDDLENVDDIGNLEDLDRPSDLGQNGIVSVKEPSRERLRSLQAILK